MKFKVLFYSFLSTTFLLTACNASELSEPLTREYETYTGEFKSLGTVQVNPMVTHLFETDEGEVLYSYSERYDLDEYTQTIEAYGIVTTHEELDKPLFEVTRLSEADEETTPVEEVKKVEYRNAELGVVTEIYSNWEVETNASSGLISFTLPTPAPESETGVVTEQEPISKDTIDLISFTNVLTTTAESTTEERSADIQTYVTQNYRDLVTVTSEQVSVGPDSLVGVRYKTAVGDIFVFIPRGSDLFELSYHYLNLDDALRIQNTNFFTGVVNAFRFIPEGEVAPEIEETPSEPSDPTVTQVEISKFSTLTSNPFQFSMSYPAAWYYAGGSTGYSFSLTAIEDVTAEAILKLTFNSGASEGTVRTGNVVSITRKVDSRTYTLSGTSEYEAVMNAMLDSIQTIKAE